MMPCTRDSSRRQQFQSEAHGGRAAHHRAFRADFHAFGVGEFFQFGVVQGDGSLVGGDNVPARMERGAQVRKCGFACF